MKKLIPTLLLMFPIIMSAQKSDYTMTSFMEKGSRAPNTHHMGEAWLNFLIQADEAFDYNITQATFSANSTLDWHTSKAEQDVSYIAIYGSEPTEWTEKLTREYYDSVAQEMQTRYSKYRN